MRMKSCSLSFRAVLGAVSFLALMAAGIVSGPAAVHAQSLKAGNSGRSP